MVREYYASGKVQKEIMYANQKPNGITKTYYETGVLESETNYRDGFISGFYKLYYPNAQLELVYTIKEGEKVGDFYTTTSRVINYWRGIL
ncbi:MAG: hypothetical protein HWD62_00385 [Cyclobacteriaceae bacterium]|nr:MAG: hypothetical protein HWD62_00385 [Cyclobacteriaceae bacterium]